VTLSGRAPHLAKRDAVVGAAWMDDIIWVHDDLDITATTAAELIDRMHAGQGSSLVGSKALHKHDYIIDRPLSLHTSA